MGKQSKRTMYSMHSEYATLSDIGRLCPTLIEEVAPGDTWSGKIGMLYRFSPVKRALLQDLYLDSFVFYIPHRLIYADWEDFVAEGPMDTPTYSLPTASVTAAATGWESLFFNSHPTESKTISYLRTYALNLVWNEFFRDENDAVKTPGTAPGQFGPEVSFKKDYWSELQDDIGYGQDEHFFDTNVGSGTQASAKDVLEAIAKQKIAMKRETYGSRYIDILRSYGISVNYQMLQRPEVVAIGRSKVNITDVVQTSADTGSLGDLAGHAIGGVGLTLKRKSFPEHGTLMGFTIVRPASRSMNFGDWFDAGILSYEDFYDPGLVPLPPVEVTKQRAIPSTLASAASDVLGYQPWGEWYRKALSRVHPQLDDSSDPWCIAQQIAQNGTDTITSLRNITPADFNSAFSNTTYRHYQVACVNHLRALRYIPKDNLSVITGMAG